MSWGNPKGFKDHALANLLTPASFAFGVGSYCRLVAYSKGLAKQRQFPATVLSVGNITCGGTGKTPVTIDLAKRLIAEGRKVAILSRGYKRLSKEPVVVASNGAGELADCTECGDEPYMMARAVPQAVIIVGAKRVQTAEMALERFDCDTIVLDDGFQHIAMARDTDVVLLDYNDDLSKDRLLPAGRLREPVSSLARADWIIVTKVPPNPDMDKLLALRTLIGRYAPKAEVSACRMSVDKLQPLGCDDVTLGASALSGTKVLALSAIARPQAFTQQLSNLGAYVADELAFGDHHWYDGEDINSIRERFSASGAEMIITTEKDAVKLRPALVKDLPIAVLSQKLEWLGPLPVDANVSVQSKSFAVL